MGHGNENGIFDERLGKRNSDATPLTPEQLADVLRKGGIKVSTLLFFHVMLGMKIMLRKSLI